MTENTDVIIVGGGGAACRAAIEASYNNAKVTMLVKGSLGESGATAYQVAESAAYNAVDKKSDGMDSMESFYDDIIEAGMGMADPKLVNVLVGEAEDSIKFLEKMGVFFEKDKEDYLKFQACFSNRPRSRVIKGHGEPIVSALKKEIKKLGIKVYEYCMLTNLFAKNGKILGLGFLDDKSNYIVIQSNSIVLATGGAGQLFYTNLNPPEITGDGYSLGYQIGAKLINLEFMQAGLGIIHPIKSLLNQWIWSGYPRLINKEKEEFLTKYLPENIDVKLCMREKALHYPFTSRDNSRYIDISIHSEINNGRGTEHNGVYLDLSNITINSSDDPVFRKMLPFTLEWLTNKGVNLFREPIEIANFGHAINGGLLINEEAETSVKGLYAAGEVAGGPHGADRLGGNMMVTCQVFGRRAGKYAALYSAKQKTYPTINKDDIKNEKHYIFSLLKKDINEKILRKQLQKTLNKGLLVKRSSESLNMCLDEIRKIKQFIIQAPSSEKNNYYNLELMNLLISGELMATAAILRKESRGSHFRVDFPEKDEKNWGGSQIIQQQEGKPNLSIYYFK